MVVLEKILNAREYFVSGGLLYFIVLTASAEEEKTTDNFVRHLEAWEEAFLNTQGLLTDNA